MKNKTRKTACLSVCMLAAFVLWTTAVRLVDVKAIGPAGSSVGFAAVNSAVHSFTGVHMRLYSLTDWLSVVPFMIIAGLALSGLVQWIKRRHIGKVDPDLLVLGGFYLITMAVYLFFEVFAVNYRPLLINGVLEVSYPSSTTTLTLCVMLTAILQAHHRIRNRLVRRALIAVMAMFAACMVAARLVSGVHWFSDIIGGVLLSTGLVLSYETVCRFIRDKG